MKNKKGISAVIETVLLVLITITAVGILSAVIIPMIRDKLDKSAECMKIEEKISIVSDEYTCTNSVKTLLKVDRKFGDESKIIKLVFSISSGDKSKNFQVENDKPTALDSELKMYANSETKLVIPAPGESKTYNISFANATSVKVTPVMEGNIICDDISERINNFCISI